MSWITEHRVEGRIPGASRAIPAAVESRPAPRQADADGMSRR